MTKFNEFSKLQEMLGKGTPMDTSAYHVGNGSGLKTTAAGAVGGGVYGAGKSYTARETAKNLKADNSSTTVPETHPADTTPHTPSLMDKMKHASGDVGKIDQHSIAAHNQVLTQHAPHPGGEHTTSMVDHIHNAFSSAKNHVMDLVHSHPLAAGALGGAAATYGAYKLGKKIFGGKRK